MTPSHSSDLSKLGVVFVLLVGPAPWWGRERGDTIDWFAVVGAVWCLPLIGALAWVGRDSERQWALLMVAGALVYLLPMLTWVVQGRWLLGTNLYVLLPARLAGAVAVAIGLDRGMDPLFIGVALFGFVAGCDASLSLHAVGIRLDPLPAVRRFATSSLNVGVALGLAVTVLVAGGRALTVALQLYGSLWLLVVLVCVLVATLQAGDDRVQAVRRADIAAVQAQERLERAHWIHDDVCADLRYVRIKLEDGSVGLDAVGVALSELDHRMRLRQLDEQIVSGTVRLAEVVQPFARKLQDRGLTLADMPSFAAANVELGPELATCVRRAVSVLTSNAMNAGAAAVAIRASVDARTIGIEVEDDAGGFRLDDIPAGRGLDRLRREVGEVSVRPTERGSIVSVVVPRRPARPSLVSPG